MLHMGDIQRLMTDMPTPTLSLYLNVNPGYVENQASTPAWRVWAKNALRDVESGLDRDQRREWQPIREQAEAFLSEYKAESRGLVLFVTAQGIEHYALPLPIDNLSAWGEPLVTPLFWKLDEYERYLVVLVDQEQARFLTAYLGHAGDEERMEIDLDEYDFREMTLSPATSHGKELNQGSNREAFEKMIDEHRARFYREVIDRLGRLAELHATDRIILGGAEGAVHTLRGLMPDALAKQVIGILPIPMNTPPHAIVERIQPLAHDHEREFEKALLDEVIDRAKSGGRGALGRSEVLKALKEQRVDLVIAPYPMDDAELMHTLPVQAMASRSRIELVHGEAADRLREEGGIAARLYYAL
jgi:hypothetical protein